MRWWVWVWAWGGWVSLVGVGGRGDGMGWRAALGLWSLVLWGSKAVILSGWAFSFSLAEGGVGG